MLTVGYPAEGFQPTPGAHDDGARGEVAVQYFDPTGRTVWAARLGGRGVEQGAGYVDAQGNAYVVGNPTTPGALGEHYWASERNRVTFLVKFSPAGRLLWAARIPGSNYAGGMAVDAEGSIYLDGAANKDFVPDPDAFDTEHVDGTPNDPYTYPFDGYVIKINSSGTRRLWGTFLGGSSDEIPGGLALTRNGNLVIAGQTRSADFPVTPDADLPTYPNAYGDDEGFLMELTGDGKSAVWSTYVDFGEAESYGGVTLKPDGTIDLLGMKDRYDPTNVPGQVQKGGLISQYTADGHHLRTITTAAFINGGSVSRDGFIFGVGHIEGQPHSRDVAVRLDLDGRVLQAVPLPGRGLAVGGDNGSMYASLGPHEPGDGARVAATAKRTTVARYTRCTIRGTRHNDVLRGTPRADVICGFGGNDKIYGLGGSDVLVGGAGTDTLYGGSGIDVLLGGRGGDRLYGGPQRDKLVGGPGSDTCPDRQGRNSFSSCRH
ncbi:calcium-binding protein [Marmoricola sp. RAF53]|uniref:calcium-binding protein n=1 Tax=Marmoricola sp. RAF53 TaxID=3233059 RepID=UPI003F994EB1